MSKPQQNSPWVYIALSVVAVLGIGAIVYLQMHRNTPQSSLLLADADTLVAPTQSQASDSVAALTPRIATVSSTMTPASVSPSESHSPVVVPSKTVSTAAPAKTTPIATSQMLPQHVATESAYKLKRDPYPLPGEKFGKPLKPAMLGEADGFAAEGQLQAKPGEIIPWNHARQYVGQTITVEGKVVLTNKTKTVCFLNFVENWRGRFYVVIFEKVLGSWPQSPEQYFLHKTIRVTGEVKDRRGTPQIQITDAKQIQVVPTPE